MPTTINIPPDVITGRRFPNIFVFPRSRILDPGNNVLMVANLFNFNIDKDQPQADHERFLGGVAAPLLVANPAGGARIVGLASRSGSALHNLDLSIRRARNVASTLSLFIFGNDLVNPPSPPPRITVGGQGEQFAANLNVKDGTEDSRFRAVLVTILRDRTKRSLVRLL